MADRVEVATVVVPAGTTSGAPYVQDVGFPAGTVVGVEITVPDGHNGLTGLQLAQAQQPVVPATPGSWIVANDRVITWPLTGYLDSGSWQAIAYNSDVFDHTFYLTFLVNNPTLADLATAPVPAVSSAGVAAAAPGQ